MDVNQTHTTQQDLVAALLENFQKYWWNPGFPYPALLEQNGRIANPNATPSNPQERKI